MSSQTGFGIYAKPSIFPFKLLMFWLAVPIFMHTKASKPNSIMI